MKVDEADFEADMSTTRVDTFKNGEGTRDGHWIGWNVTEPPDTTSRVTLAVCPCSTVSRVLVSSVSRLLITMGPGRFSHASRGTAAQ